MGHTADIAQHHKARGVEHGKLGKGVAHVPPGEGARSLWVMGELLTYKIPSHKTGGAYALFEGATKRGAGPPPHIHHREDESFYVLEGKFEFLNGRETLRVGAGSLVYVPKGTLHAHRGVGEGLGRMLVTQTPGGLFERFFEEVREAVDGDGGPLVIENQSDATNNIVAIAAKYGIEIPPPTVPQ